MTTNESKQENSPAATLESPGKATANARIGWRSSAKPASTRSGRASAPRIRPNGTVSATTRSAP